jgi:hypothetical protein
MLNRQRAFFTVTFVTLMTLLTLAAPTPALAAKKRLHLSAPAPYDQTYQDLNSVLQKYVHANGAVSQVDYKQMRAHQIQLLAFLKNTSKLSHQTFESFNDNQKVAFLINAYNAYTLKLIIDNYPVSSIKKMSAAFKNPWKIKFVRLFGQDMTLDDIEHKWLEEATKDPRIHLAINCACVGGPGLRNEAFTAEKLDSQLTEQASIFLRDNGRNSIDPVNKTLKLSSALKALEGDSGSANAALQKFVGQFMTDDPNVKKDLEAGLYAVTYGDQDWNLNDLKN